MGDAGRHHGGNPAVRHPVESHCQRRRHVHLRAACRTGPRCGHPHADGDVHADGPLEVHHGHEVRDTDGHAAGRTTPIITWATPAAITAGTPLSGTQLNATASVAGTFTYAPPRGPSWRPGRVRSPSPSRLTDSTQVHHRDQVGELTVGASTTTPSGCVLPTTTSYPGFDYRLRTARPFISLAHYDAADRASSAYVRFKSAADAAVNGAAPYGYTAVQSVTMYALTGDARYIDEAIARVEAVVTAAEAAIAAGTAPAVAFDSYLKVGGTLKQLAFTYDYGYGRLPTPSGSAGPRLPSRRCSISGIPRPPPGAAWPRPGAAGRCATPPTTITSASCGPR